VSATAVLITDGRRDYFEQTFASCREMIPSFDPVIIDDSGDADYGAWLDTLGYHVAHHEQREGLAAAVRTAWTLALGAGAQFIWHQEDDFVLTEPVPIEAMERTLLAHPALAQLVLKRQPWSEEEIAAGGQIEIAPDEYVDREGFVEHLRLFSLNPSLIRREVIECALAEPGDGLERGITDTLLVHGYTFAYWGARKDPPRCWHIGERRSEGYRW
jgi:hypothetical protein